MAHGTYRGLTVTVYRRLFADLQSLTRGSSANIQYILGYPWRPTQYRDWIWGTGIKPLVTADPMQEYKTIPGMTPLPPGPLIACLVVPILVVPIMVYTK